MIGRALDAAALAVFDRPGAALIVAVAFVVGIGLMLRAGRRTSDRIMEQARLEHESEQASKAVRR